MTEIPIAADGVARAFNLSDYGLDFVNQYDNWELQCSVQTIFTPEGEMWGSGLITEYHTDQQIVLTYSDKYARTGVYTSQISYWPDIEGGEDFAELTDGPLISVANNKDDGSTPEKALSECDWFCNNFTNVDNFLWDPNHPIYVKKGAYFKFRIAGFVDGAILDPETRPGVLDAGLSITEGSQVIVQGFIQNTCAIHIRYGARQWKWWFNVVNSSGMQDIVYTINEEGGQEYNHATLEMDSNLQTYRPVRLPVTQGTKIHLNGLTGDWSSAEFILYYWAFDEEFSDQASFDASTMTLTIPQLEQVVYDYYEGGVVDCVLYCEFMGHDTLVCYPDVYLDNKLRFTTSEVIESAEIGGSGDFPISTYVTIPTMSGGSVPARLENYLDGTSTVSVTGSVGLQELDVNGIGVNAVVTDDYVDNPVVFSYDAGDPFKVKYKISAQSVTGKYHCEAYVDVDSIVVVTHPCLITAYENEQIILYRGKQSDEVTLRDDWQGETLYPYMLHGDTPATGTYEVEWNDGRTGFKLLMGSDNETGSYTLIFSESASGYTDQDGTVYYVELLHEQPEGIPECYFSRYLKDGVESRLYLDNVESITDSYQVNMVDIPIQVLPVRNRYLLDMGNVETMSVTFSRAQPRIIHNDSTDSRDWSNAKWVREYRNFFDIWQNLTYDDMHQRSGGFIFTFKPCDSELYPDVRKNVFVNGGMDISHKLGVIRGTISLTVASMLLKAAIAPLNTILVFSKDLSKTKVVERGIVSDTPFQLPPIPSGFYGSNHTPAGWSLVRVESGGDPIVYSERVYYPGELVNPMEELDSAHNTLYSLIEAAGDNRALRPYFVARTMSYATGVDAWTLLAYSECTDESTTVRSHFTRVRYGDEVNSPTEIDRKSGTDDEEITVDLPTNTEDTWFEITVVGAGGGPGKSDAVLSSRKDSKVNAQNGYVIKSLIPFEAYWTYRDTTVAGGGGAGERKSTTIRIPANESVSMKLNIGRGGKYEQDGEPTSIEFVDGGFETISARGGLHGLDIDGGSAYVKGGNGAFVESRVSFDEDGIDDDYGHKYGNGSGSGGGKGSYWGAGGGAADLNTTIKFNNTSQTIKSTGGTANGGHGERGIAKVTRGMYGGGAASHYLNDPQDYVRKYIAHGYQQVEMSGAGSGVILIRKVVLEDVLQ